MKAKTKTPRPYAFPARSRREMVDFILAAGTGRGYFDGWGRDGSALAFHAGHALLPGAETVRAAALRLAHEGYNPDVTEADVYDAYDECKDSLGEQAMEEMRDGIRDARTGEAECSWNYDPYEKPGPGGNLTPWDAQIEFHGGDGQYVCLTSFRGLDLRGCRYRYDFEAVLMGTMTTFGEELTPRQARSRSEDAVLSFGDVRALYRACVVFEHDFTPAKMDEMLAEAAAFRLMCMAERKAEARVDAERAERKAERKREARGLWRIRQVLVRCDRWPETAGILLCIVADVQAQYPKIPA